MHFGSVGLRGVIYFFLLIPFVVGAVSVAEERKLGTLGVQLSQPISPRRQWWAKLLVTSTISFVLGVVLPAVLLLSVRWRIPEAQAPLIEGSNSWRTIGLYCLSATTLGLFASSLARTFLHAMSWPSLLVAALAAIEAFVMRFFQGWQPPPIRLFNLIAIPLFLILLLVLASSNFRLESVTRRDWARNLMALAAGLLIVCTVTAAAYARVWEAFIPQPRLDPAAVLAGPVEPKISLQWLQPAVLFPNGTLARGRFTTTLKTDKHQVPERAFYAVSHHWRDVSGPLAVRVDGTLWSWTDPQFSVARLGEPTAEPSRLPGERGPVKQRKKNSYNGPFPVQVGPAKDWQTVCGGWGLGFGLAIKTNGTLWAWGDNRAGQLADGTTEPHATPAQVSSDSDWDSVASYGLSVFGIKKDGTLWGWGSQQAVAANLQLPEQVTKPRRIGAGTNWKRIMPNSRFCLALRTDGTLWLWGVYIEYPLCYFSADNPQPLGTSARWKMASAGLSSLEAFGAGGPPTIFAIREDGTLWRWPGFDQLHTSAEFPSPEQAGSRTDWLTVSGDLAMTSDGVIWAWTHAHPEDGLLSKLIPPSQRPHQIASY